MAKTDNLTDFLTGVAGAIRTKKGTTALINPQDFESEIGSIDTAKPEQTKTLTVTENGTQTVKPDTGKVLSGVTVTTNVPATPTKEKTVDLSMTSGNQVITPTSGKVISKATIKKPATMIPANIRKDVNIGGVVGTMVEEHHTEQEKTADLNMASGNQIVNADSGKVMTRVTITKPTSMVASNIRKGTDIGGVVGTMEEKVPEEAPTVELAMSEGDQVISATTGKVMTKVTVTKPATLTAGNIKSGVNIGGVTGTLSPAKTEQAKTVDLAMASGNQVVSPDSGKVLSGVTITKPATLVASNIKKGVTIGGVAGSYAPAFTTETKIVALEMGSGNQVISKSSGKDGMTQVTITKPSTMLPANIKKGVNIGGVTGTYEGESSGGKEVWMLDKNNPPLLNSGDGDYADQPFSVGSGQSQEWYKIVVTSGEVKAVVVSGDHTKDYIIGNNNIAFNRFEYKLKDAYRKKMVFPKPVTGTLLQVLTKIAVKQPDNYAIQGYNNSAKTKKVTITSNGTTTITPDAPYDAMKNVAVTVNVAGTGSSKMAMITLKGSAPYNIRVYDTANPTEELARLNYMDDMNRGEVRLPIQGNLKLNAQGYWSQTGLPTYTDMELLTPTTASTSELEYRIIGAVGSITDLGTITCFIKGTLITLADGSKKPVEDITYDDELLVWNFYKGCFDKAKPRWIKIAQTASVYNKLTFDNGATLGLVGEGGTQGYHRIFNEQARLFTHTGVPETPVGTITFAEDCTKPTLVKQELVHEEVEFYNVITETHFNLFANGILTSCKNSNKYYIENMKYVTDKELMTDAEIEQDMLNREPIKLKKEIK